MNEEQILKILEKYEAKSAHPYSLVWKEAFNSFVFDDKNKYIDFSSGIFTTNSGHLSTDIYLKQQINRNLIYSYSYATEIRAKLIKKLMNMVPRYLEKVVLSTTGASSVEIALKLMRLVQVKRSTVMSIYGAMHGKTLLTEALSGKKRIENVVVLPYPYENSEVRIPDDVGSIILESYEGYSGRFLPIKWLKKLMLEAKRKNVLVCFDEIQGGFWRTGKLFAYQHYNVKPDLVCIGKGFGGGVPISGVIGKKEILDIGKDLTSTYAGNPLSCAGALGNLLELEKINKKELNFKGQILERWLIYIKYKYPLVVLEINSKGLLGAIIFKDEKIATSIYKMAINKGLLLVHTGRESIKIGPPLIISEENLKKGLDILEDCIKEI